MFMDPLETHRLRREILSDLTPLLHEEFAADAWGRALVEVARTPSGEIVVAGIDVEEIVGDETEVDTVFEGVAAKALLPTLAKATEALCALDGVELDEVHGGTFVRLEQGFGWLPGLVRAPSQRLDRERDALLARLGEKNGELQRRFAADRVDIDVEGLRVQWLSETRSIGVARATTLGTFARATRTWAWAWHNPSLTEPVRRDCATVTDALPERDLWEISTAAFATDEATAWVLAAYVCDRTNADGVKAIARDDGVLFVLVRNVLSS
jgi:hypothetical protein